MVDPVDDYGLEVIRKAAQLNINDNKYDIRVDVKNADNVTLDQIQVLNLISVQNEILKELKIISFHLSKGSGEEIGLGDV